MAKYILGISAYYHDSAAAIVCDGEIIAAAQEERFSRKKHDPSFPHHAIAFVLEAAGIRFDELDSICFYDKPFLKFERLLETYHAFAPRGLFSFLKSMPVWIKDKLFLKNTLRREFKKFGKKKIPLLFPEHHLSHAASAFYPSPFEEAAILTIDGVGEWSTTTIGYGKGNNIKIISELHFPHSLGLLYSAFTYYCGFTVNSGEYKLMGLAPYGDANAEQTKSFVEKIQRELIDIREDGSFLLNMKYFDFATGLTMTNNRKWLELFGIPPRIPESEITRDHMNMALAIQQVSENVILRLAATAKRLTNCDQLVMAGGVALNGVANGRILKSGIFNKIWIQPAAGDAGGALGAALAGWHLWMGEKRDAAQNLPDAMKAAFLGPEYNNEQIKKMARSFDAVYSEVSDIDKLSSEVAGYLADGNIVGWFQGKMEFGPRALGSRSILADARDPEMQKKMNLKTKRREGFRPFAPSVMEEDVAEYFEINTASPYMMFVIPVKECRLKETTSIHQQHDVLERLYQTRSEIPSVTHIDHSARIQTVNYRTNPRFWKLLNAFKQHTGCPILINTSFNVRGEPIVCTPEQAFRCFMKTEMDFLIMGNIIFDKKNQEHINMKDWKSENGSD